MGSLTIRNIPDEAKHLFRQRAAANGRSMEEEARQMILAAAAQEQPKRKSLWQMLHEASRPGFDLPIPERSAARVPDLGPDLGPDEA